MPKRITPEEANRTKKPCSNGHVGCWEEHYNYNHDKAKPTRRCYQCSRDRNRASIYGLTPEAYAQLKEEQPLCAICGEDGSDCGMGSLEIDHDHNTGEVRGLLCRRCNIFLGHYESRKHLLPAIERYLNRVP